MDILLLANTLHHGLGNLLELTMVVLEIMAFVIILSSGVSAFYQFVVLHYSNKFTDLAIRLGQGLSLSLSFYLAAEILKTATAQSFQDLYLVGALILIRGLIALLLHWETKSDSDLTGERPETAHQEISSGKVHNIGERTKDLIA